MSESKFKHLQKEVCAPELEPPPLKKFCAPCVPNQSYIEPDWEFVEIGEPYLNEKQCEYQITVAVNKFGNSFTAREFREAQGSGRSSDGPLPKRDKTFASRDLLLRSFIHPAIVLILEEYGKLVADQIICATFPGLSGMGSPQEIISELDSFEGAFMKLVEQEIDDTRMRCLDFGTKVTRPVDPSEPFDFQRNIIELASNAEIQNPFALELYAQVNDFYIDPIEDILKVHIGIPAFIVDQVPELPSKEELEEEALSTRESVLLSVDKLFGQMKRLEASLQVFGKYQSQFYQSQNGFLKFKESKKDFYATRMSSKVSQFYKDLKELATANKVNIRSNIPSLTKLNADNVRIEFKTGPNGNPYIIKAVYAWKQGCEEKKLRKGIKRFKKKYDKKPTVVNYIAKLSDIDMTLQARETTPWLDFLIQYTYPLVIVDYGSLNMQAVGDTLGKCVEENAREFGGELRDYILNEALSFMQSMSYQYSSAASCEDLYSKENQPEEKEFEADYDAGREAKKETKERLKDDPTSVVQEQFLEKLKPLEDKMRILKEQESSKRKEIERLENLPRDYNGEVQYQVKEAIDNANKEIVNIVVEISATEIEANTILRDAKTMLEESNSEDGLSRKSKRQLRKNAGKKARSNRKKHPYAKKAAKIAIEDLKKNDTLLSSLVDWEKYEKEGKFRGKWIKREDRDSLKDILSRLSICSLNELTVNAIRCLFSGVTKERAFDKMFRAAMQAMDLDVFGFFIGGLPPQAQLELRKKFEEEFGNIPLPWEEGYDSGSENKNAYKGYLSSYAETQPDELAASNVAKSNKDIEAKIQQLKEDYDNSLNNKASLMVDLEDAQIKYDQISGRLAAASAAPQGAVPELVPGGLDDIKAGLREELVLASVELAAAQEHLDAADNPATALIEIQKLEKQLAETPVVEAEESKELKDFKDMTDEEKKNALAEQEKAQGTFGKPLGNIQEAVVEAYIEYIFDVMNIDQIGEAMSQVPGGTLVFNTINQIFKCSSQGLFNPPIKSFLSSLSLDVCGDDRHVGLAFPSKVKEIEMPEFGKAFFIKKLKNAFIAKMETVVTKVITMLLLKVFESIDNALCKSLNAVGQAAIGTLTGGSSSTMQEAFADAFCPDADEDELNNVQKNLFGNALGQGAVPDSAYDCLFKAVNGTMSKREILDLLTNTPSNMDDATASKFALLVNSRCPELSDLLGDPEDVKDAFGSMGKYIPPELKEYLRDQNDNDLDAPIYDAICLTQDELDLWNANRKQLYLDNGLDEETADELINKANDRALDNLGALSDIVQKGPQGLLEEAIDAILKQPDPACANDPAAILVEDEELASAKADLFNNYFERIEGKFLEDLIGERDSLIGNILIDTEGNHMQQHNRRVKIGDRTVLFADYVDSEQQWDEREDRASRFKKLFMDKNKKRGMLPETVGISMLNQLKEIEFKYKTNKDEPQLKLRFEATDFEVFRDTTIDTVLAYKLNHNKKSTQRVSVRENIHNPPFNPTSDIVISARKNQVFEPEDITGVNYEAIPNEIKMFKDLLVRKSNSSTPIKTSRVISLFDDLNSKALTVIRDAVIETTRAELPVGFKYGYEEGASVGFEDLLYVNPDADPNDDSTWEYTFEEENAVLGKSATENPRVHFLDPAVHGGRYKFPKIYIEPATYGGWLGAIRTFIPQIQTCEDKDNGFLDITGISNRVKKVESNLPIDSRLSQPLECRLEVPYDRQLMPANHGLIEGIVISTIRTYATEFMVRSFPVFGSIQFNENNYDSLISKSLAGLMQTEMSNAGVFANISRLAYYLLFLEQCVQVVQRQIIDGLMEETEEMKAASKIINRAQNNFEKLKFGDFVKDIFDNSLPKSISSQMNKGSRIIAYGNQWVTTETKSLASIRGLTPYKINLARKIAVIHDTQQAAEVFLAALVAKETTTLSKKMNLNLRPSPHVYDVGRYMLSTKGIVDQSDIKAGFASVEQEVIEGGSQPDYGSILDCAGSDLKSPLGSISKTLEDIKKTGFMYLEKYVRVINKDSTEQVMKISEFQQMISDRSIYDEEMRLSDYFGNAFVVARTLQGSIGVKMGVRLMMCLDKHIGLTPDLDLNTERISTSLTSGEESFGVLCFPVASYELDVIDDQIKDLDLEDPTMGEDIKCYVDQLTETEDYKLLFDTIIKTRSFCSLFGIYSFQNFANSIGQVEVEDEGQKILMNDGWKRRIFNETKSLLRKQFRSVYNSQDDGDGEKSSTKRTSNIDFLKNLVPDLYLNIKGVGFLQRLRIVDANPFDEDGKPCVNEFQKIFED
jgi:hypothetical protein